jgi:hypothetical protein
VLFQTPRARDEGHHERDRTLDSGSGRRSPFDSFSLINCISVGVDRMQRNFVPGLEEEAMYAVSTIDDKIQWQTEKVSGAYLMHHGLQLRLRGDYATATKVDRIP